MTPATPTEALKRLLNDEEMETDDYPEGLTSTLAYWEEKAQREQKELDAAPAPSEADREAKKLLAVKLLYNEGAADIAEVHAAAQSLAVALAEEKQAERHRFDVEWALAVTEERRALWNGLMVGRMPKTWTEIRAIEREVGFSYEHLKRAIVSHRLPAA